MQDKPSFAFGSYTLDTRRGVLLKNGTEVPLRPQSLAVLEVLLRKAGTLVSKDELHRDVWAGKVVTDDSITHCIIDIRNALGDKQRSLVRTLPRRGYMLDTAVTVIEPRAAETAPSTAPATHKSRRGLAALWILALTTAMLVWLLRAPPAPDTAALPPSIAILRLDDLSAQQDKQYLADGLAEDVLNALAQQTNLRVIARTSSFALSTEEHSVEEIRDTLDVAYVLEGSIRPLGASYRITAQLINTADSSHIWSRTYDPIDDELLIVPERIANDILASILPNSPAIQSTEARQNVTANELMLLASFYERQVRDRPAVDEEKLDAVIRLYRGAVLADPDSAIAHSRLAGALLYRGDVLDAEPIIYKALSLNPNISEVQTTLGQFYWAQQLPGQGAVWKRAIELNPNNADALAAYGYWQWFHGLNEEPEQLFRQALKVDPLALTRYSSLGYFLALTGERDAALELLEKIEQLFDSAESYRLIARLNEILGHSDQAIAWLIRARDKDPDNPDHIYALAEAYADLGDKKTALQLDPAASFGLLIKLGRYNDAIQKGEPLLFDKPDDLSLRYWLAFAYTSSNRPADALRLLRPMNLPERAYSETRLAIDIEALTTLIGALDANGEQKISREHANRWIERKHAYSPNWWINYYLACPMAVAGRHDEAMEKLDKISESPWLPWLFLIRDSRCFQQYKDQPRYQAILTNIQKRQADYRARLPETLREFDVEL